MDDKELKATIGSDLLSEMVVAIRGLIDPLSADQRVAIWQLITEGYCTECGSKNPHCQCCNDE